MRLSTLLFAAPAVLYLIVGAAFFVSPSLWPAAGPHPDYVSLDRTVAGSQPTLWLGYAMALALLATLAVSAAIGVRRGGWLGPWLGAGFLGLGLIFTALIVSYVRYAGGVETRLFLGLPAPTAWMLYGVWPFSFVIILVCMFHFDSYFSEDDERAFDTLIREKRAEEEDGG